MMALPSSRGWLFFAVFGIVLPGILFFTQENYPIARRKTNFENSNRSSCSDDNSKNGITRQDNLLHPRKHVYPPDVLPQRDLLNANHVPNSVFWVWCGRRWFEFHHYLCVLSVMKEFRPNTATFYYDSYPMVDGKLYNTWLGELKEQYPFLHTQKLQASDNGCDKYSHPNITFITSTLTKMGGFHFSEHTLIAQFSQNLKNLSFINGYELQKHAGFYMSARGLPGEMTVDKIMHTKGYATKSMQCIDKSSYMKHNQTSPCVILTDPIFPKDIWDLKNDLGKLARWVFYGTEEIIRPQPNLSELAPNIAHLVWIGGGKMNYIFYLCVLSLLYVVQVDTLYIHGNGPPTGIYWDSIKNNPRVQTIYRETWMIYENKVNVLAHVSDVWRVDIMLRYGGIYCDTDVIWVRPLDKNIRAYDAVGSYDWPYWNHPFPDIFSMGITVGKRNTPYWQKCQESMKWFRDGDWGWNGMRQSYKIMERHPDLALVEPRLQVICWGSKCHPTWWPNYHNESVHHLNSPSLPNWRQDACAYHFTDPNPPELKDEVSLMASNSTFAQMGKYVLEKAGRLPKTVTNKLKQ